MDSKQLRGLMEAYQQVNASQEEIVESEQIDEAEGSYGSTAKAYSAASKTKMTAKRKPFLKAMKSRTNPANRTDPYGSPRKGLTADDRERARAGSKHGVGTRQDHDYPSEGPGGVTKSAKKLRKQKALGEIGEGYDIFDVVLEFLQAEGFAETLEEAEWIMANLLGKEEIDIIVEASCEDDEEEMKKGKKSKKSEEDEEDEEEELEEASYSATAARAGKDIGKPGKAFAKIAKSAAKRYGSKERGEKVAGAVLAKLRSEEIEDLEYDQQLNELSNRKLRAYIKKSGKSHAEINKKWDQGTATDKEKIKSIGHEIGQQRAFKTLDKRSGK